ncbi:hypothetical protein HMI56_000747 [Coelomomyces lativittatus]|nr:hypothetical protein HMI56_000747 [Coelomomyces lativittatus]
MIIGADLPGPSLAETTFRSVLKTLKQHGRDHPPLVSVTPTTSIQECLGIMAHHTILSVPVTSHSSPTKYTCILSVLDIIGALVESEKSHEFVFQQSVEFAMTLEPSRESYRVVERDIDDTLAETLADFSHGLHRLLLSSVVNPNAPSMLFTPSDVLRYVKFAIQEKLSSAPLLHPDSKVKELGIAHVKELFFVTPKAKAQDAFQILWQKNVMALPILDDEGHVIGGISSSSLRGMEAKNISWLQLPVLEFLEKVYDGKVPITETCTFEAHIGDLINRISSATLHRIWVLENEKCIGVVTLGDLISLFYRSK